MHNRSRAGRPWQERSPPNYKAFRSPQQTTFASGRGDIKMDAVCVCSPMVYLCIARHSTPAQEQSQHFSMIVCSGFLVDNACVATHISSYGLFHTATESVTVGRASRTANSHILIWQVTRLWVLSGLRSISGLA